MRSKQMVRRALDPLRVRLPHRIKRPIFVVAPPRSGSTFLFEALSRLGGVHAFTAREAEHVWWAVLPYDCRPGADDQILPSQLSSASRRRVTEMLYTEARREQDQAGYARTFIGMRPIRYLDKTISNCFHLELITEMYPDVEFVYLIRDPRANIASMIEGWPEIRRFGKRQLSPIIAATPGATIQHWTYPAPPGWQTVLGRDLASICAWSWQQHAEAIASFRATHDRGRLVTYETLINDPEAIVSNLAAALDLQMTDAAREFLRKAPASRTTVSPPEPEKWTRFQSEIERVLPDVATTAERFGYGATDR